MAYIGQEKKRKVAAELKKIVPSDWKWSLRIRHHSELIFTVFAGPAELVTLENGEIAEYVGVNVYYLDRYFSGETLELMEKIHAAMMHGNHNNSDPMTDYFDVGWYTDIDLGRWDKPYKVV